MPNLLDELKALPPPSGGGVLNDFQSLPPPYSPQNANDTRIAQRSHKAVIADLQTTGIPTTPLLPDFDPPSTGDRKYLTKHTSGTLDLDLDSVSPTKLDTSALQLQSSFLSSHPAAAQLLSDPGPDADPQAKAIYQFNYGRLAGHHKALAAIKDVPSSPREKLSSISQAWQDWSTAELFGAVGAPDKYPNRAQVPPALAVNVLTKLVDAPAQLDPAERTLRLGNLSPDERQAFDAMGGWDSVFYAQSREAYYTQRARLSKLTGQPPAPPQQPHKLYVNQEAASQFAELYPTQPVSFDEQSTVPRSFPLSLESLQPVSSFSRDLLSNATTLATIQAQHAADADAAFGTTPAGRLLGGPAARYLSENILDQPTGEEAFGQTNVMRRTKAALLGASAGLAVNAGSKLLGDYGPMALNVALLGVPQTVGEALHTTIEATGEALAGDKDLLFRGYQHVKQSAVRRLALGGDETDKSLARNADALFGSFPDADPLERIDIGAQYFPASVAVNSLLKRTQESELFRTGTQVFGLSTPLAREAVGSLVDASTDTADALAMSGTFAAGLFHWARRGFKPKVLKDPLKSQAFTEFEKGLGEAGSYSAAAPELRSRMLEPITRELDRIQTPEAATQLLDRYSAYLKQDGVPVTPESAARVAAAANKLATLDQKLNATKLSKAAKAALRELNEPIADLPDIDQGFILRGDEAYVGPQGSIRRIERLINWLRRQSEVSEALADPTGVGEIALGELHDAQKGLLATAARTNEFAKRQFRLLEVTGDLRKSLLNERSLLEDQVQQHLALAEDVSKSWNSFLAGEIDLAMRIEQHGLPVDAPNPASRTSRFKKLTTAIVDKDAATLDSLFEKDPAWQTLKSTIEADLGYGVPPDAVQAKLQAARLDHAKAELKASLRPTQVSLGPLPEPSKIPETLVQRLQSSVQEGSFLRLSKEEQAWLNDWRKARGLDPIPKQPAHLKSIVASAEDYHKRLQATESALKSITTFRDNLIKATPDAGFKVPAQRELVTEIRNRLSDPTATYLGDTYVALSEAASKAELSGLQAFDEATKRYSAEHHALVRGFQKIASTELAWLSSQNPALLRPYLEDLRRNTQGDLNRANARLLELDKIVGRKLSDAERLQLAEDMRTGKPRTDESAIMLQKQRMDVIKELYDAGAITAEQLQNYSKTDYFHNTYSDDAKPALDEQVTLNPPRLPPKFSPLSVDSKDFLGFKLPDKDWYVAYREKPGADLKYVLKDPASQKTFADKAAAEDWLASPSNHIPPGSEVAVRAPWLITDREIAGLIREPMTSHADLMAKAARVISTHRLTSGLRQTPHIRTEAELIRRANINQGQFSESGSSFFDGETTWLRIDNPKLPHLHGTFASKQILDHLRLYEESFPWIQATTEAFAEATSAWKNALLDPRMKAFVYGVKGGQMAIKGATNAFTAGRVGLSPMSMVQNQGSNLTFSHFTGLSPFTHPLKFMKYNLEYFKARYMAPSADKYMDALYSRDLIRRAGLRDGEIITKNIEAHWNSVSAKYERIARLERESEAHLAAGNPEAAARTDVFIDKLKDDLKVEGKAAYKGFLKTMVGHAQKGFEEFAGLLKGRGKLNTGLWNFYGEVGFDNSVKYANLKYLVEEKGFSMEDALRRVETFTQQLHRVPKAIKNATNKLGGAMFVGYQYEQLRILGNILRHAPTQALMTSAAIMAANSATLAATGENERDFLESYAMQLGLQRSSLTDMAAMGGRLLLPNSRGGVSSMSLGPFTYDVFMPQSKAFQGINSATDATINSTLGTGTLGAIARGIKTAALGVVSKFAAADLFSEGLRALYTQQTSRGDPLKTGHDWIKYGLELFTPPGAPGSPQYEQTRNVLADREVNPRTGRATTPIELAQALVLRARPFLDSPARFQLAMTEVMKGKEEFYNFQRNIAYDDMLTTRLAQGGVYRPDGSLDVDKATPIAEEFYREHPVTTLDLKTKERTPTPTTATQVQEALKRYNSPGAITSFHSLPLDRQIEIYAHWRNIDREAPKRDPKWTALVKDSILSKLRTGRSSGVEHTQAVRAVSQQLLDSGLLPKDAADDVRTWVGTSTQLLYNSFENRR